MRTQPLIGIGVLALAFCAAAADGFAQDVTLRYQWREGDESRTRMTEQASTTISAAQLAGAGGGSVESTMTEVFRTLVEEVAADGSATLQQVIESVRVEMRLRPARFSSTATRTAPTPAPTR